MGSDPRSAKLQTKNTEMRSEGWDEMGNLVLPGFPNQLLGHRSDSGNTLSVGL